MGTEQVLFPITTEKKNPGTSLVKSLVEFMEPVCLKNENLFSGHSSPE